MRREPLLPLALLTLLAAALRIVLLDMPMRLDEATTFNEFVLQPWRSTLTKYWATNNHPLHSILAKITVDLFGRSPWAVRIPALVAGIALVPLSYFVARRLSTRGAAWYTAIGVSVLAPFVLFSTNARGYSMVAVFALLQWLAVRDALERERTTSWILVALFGALGVYTHLTMAFAYAGNMAWAVLWMVRRRRFTVRTLRPAVVAGVASIGMAVVLYAPYAYVSGLDALVANDNVSAKGVSAFLRDAPNLLGRIGKSWGTGLPLWLAIAAGVLAAVAVLAGIRAPTVEALLPLVSTAALVLFLAVSLRLPPPRSTLYLLPLVLAAVGALASRLTAGRGRVTAALVWGACALPLAVVTGAHLTAQPVRTISETGWMPEGEAIYERLQATIAPGDAIASLWLPRDILRYYYLRDDKGRAPLLPEVCPAPPNVLYIIVRRSETIPMVLEYVGLPAAVGEGATKLGTDARYTTWRTTVPEGLTCPPRRRRAPPPEQ
jgi:hypothetical protein